MRRFSVRFRSLCLAAFVCLAGLGLATDTQGATATGTEIEILTRGPVHEAFASSPEPMTRGGCVVKSLPPDPIQELPPDHKPNRENVQWIPGYWHWDEEHHEYQWISGIWRVPPPGRVWIPGNWHTVRGGHQWVAGFWQSAVIPNPPRTATASQAEMLYLPPPPDEPQETVAPKSTSPETTFFIAGHWLWQDRYVWQPGFWADHRPDWTWVPARYSWTPAGYVFVSGYWDYLLPERGTLFAPVRLANALVARTSFVFTPGHVVTMDALVTALFIRHGYGNYFFGDYFDARYAAAGYRDFGNLNSGSGFAATNRNISTVRVDPLWSAVQFQHRADATWLQNMTKLYQGRLRGEQPRPPQTFAQQMKQSDHARQIQTNDSRTPRANPFLVTAVNLVQPFTHNEPSSGYKPVPLTERHQARQFALEMQSLANQRRLMETRLVDRGQAATSPKMAPQRTHFAVSPVVMAQVIAYDSRTVPPLPEKSTRNELHGSATTSAPVTAPEIALAGLHDTEAAGSVIPAQGFAKPAPVDAAAIPKAAPQLPQPRMIPRPPPLSLLVPNRK